MPRIIVGVKTGKRKISSWLCILKYQDTNRVKTKINDREHINFHIDIRSQNV